MIVLDTNVLSELLRSAPAPQVVAWLAGQGGAQVYLTAITAAELRYGVACLPAGARRTGLARALDGILGEDFNGRILAFDERAAEAYSDIAAERRGAGRPISQFDAQIAAICRLHGFDLATRNVKDFVGCGVRLIDPWSAPA